VTLPSGADGGNGRTLGSWAERLGA